jgi:S-adenosylmethionine hydrolase
VFEQGLGKQKLLAAKYENYYFIAPDNGVLTLIFDEKPDLIVEVDLKQAKLRYAGRLLLQSGKRNYVQS